MTFGEKFIRGTAMGVMAFGVETAFQLAHVIAQATITVSGIPIELPQNAKRLGSTYTVADNCLHEHPEDAEEACRKMEKIVLRIGGSVGSVVLENGEVYMLKGERGNFDFIDQALVQQAAQEDPVD